MTDGPIVERRSGRADPEGSPPVQVTEESLSRVEFEPLRALASEALAHGEAVALLVGGLEDGSRVETLHFAPSGRGAQSSGSWVYAGLWSGNKVLTPNGHALDRDGCCFCRACDLANGHEQGDED